MTTIPRPADVVLEYTYPRDFAGTSSWRDVVAAGQYFRVIVDPSVTEMPDSIFQRPPYSTYRASVVELRLPAAIRVPQPGGGQIQLQTGQKYPCGGLQVGQ